MSLLTVEVEIAHGQVRALPPDHLPESGRGYLTLLSPAPAIEGTRYTIAAGADGLPVIQASGTITSAQVREIENLLP